MGKLFRKHLLADSNEVSWSIWEGDDYNVFRITLKFSTAPSAIENIIVKIDSGSGAAYDCIIDSYDPNGQTDVCLEGYCNIPNGDKLLVTYANTGSHTISGVATVGL